MSQPIKSTGQQRTNQIIGVAINQSNQGIRNEPWAFGSDKRVPLELKASKSPSRSGGYPCLIQVDYLKVSCMFYTMY